MNYVYLLTYELYQVFDLIRMAFDNILFYCQYSLIIYTDFLTKLSQVVNCFHLSFAKEFIVENNGCQYIQVSKPVILDCKPYKVHGKWNFNVSITHLVQPKDF